MGTPQAPGCLWHGPLAAASSLFLKASESLRAGCWGVGCLQGVWEGGWTGVKEAQEVEDRFLSGTPGRIRAAAAAGDSTARPRVFGCLGMFLVQPSMGTAECTVNIFGRLASGLGSRSLICLPSTPCEKRKLFHAHQETRGKGSEQEEGPGLACCGVTHRAGQREQPLWEAGQPSPGRTLEILQRGC